MEFSRIFQSGLCSEELVCQTQIKIEQIRKKAKERKGGMKEKREGWMDYPRD
jgi:hypothetical protein